LASARAFCAVEGFLLPVVFPDCDQVIIVHLEKKGIIRRKTQPVIKGLISSENFKDKFSNEIRSIETEIGTLPAILPEEAKTVETAFFGLTSELVPNDYVRIAPDNIIDVSI